MAEKILHFSCDLIITNLRWYSEIPDFSFNLAFHSKQSYTRRCKSPWLPMQVCCACSGPKISSRSEARIGFLSRLLPLMLCSEGKPISRKSLNTHHRLIEFELELSKVPNVWFHLGSLI